MSNILKSGMAKSKSNTNGVISWSANNLVGAVSNSSPYTIASNSISSVVDTAMTINQGKMTITVPLEINGIDVEQVLKDLMNITGVVARNKRLEDKYKGLRESGERYQALLQKVQYDANIIIKEAAVEYRLAEEKYKVFETIKDSK
jgi:hypothetical protein